MTRFQGYLSIFGHLQHENLPKFADVGLKFCQIGTKRALKKLPNVFVKFRQSGDSFTKIQSHWSFTIIHIFAFKSFSKISIGKGSQMFSKGTSLLNAKKKCYKIGPFPASFSLFLSFQYS